MLRIGVIMYQTSLTKGQELVAQRMVKEFRRLGHDAYLITSIFQDSEPVIKPDEVKKRGGYALVFDSELRIPVIRVGSEGTTWPPRRISFGDFMGVLDGICADLKLNVLITHSTLWNGPEEVAKFVAWRRRMVEGGAPQPPIVFCHMSHFQEASDERYALVERSYRDAWNDMTLPQVIAEADLVLVTTPIEADIMKKMGAREEKIFLFPGGIEDEMILSPSSGASLAAKLGLPGSAKLVSFLGTVEERKNVLGLVEVAKLLADRNDVRFVIAGKADGEYADKVRKAAEGLPNVTVTGSLSEAEKAALIQMSTVNLTLSRSEALGISQLEFMSAGVPVVTSGVGGQAWVVKDGSNGILVKGPDDITGAADAIRKLVDHPHLRKRMGRQAMRTASAYSLTRLVDRLSNRIDEELWRRSQGTPTLETLAANEQVIEAWVHKGQSVAATTKRLIVKKLGNGDRITSVPYDDITTIQPHSEASWSALAIGAMATFLLLGQRIAGFGLIRSQSGGISNALSPLGLASLTQTLVAILPFVPLLLGVVAFLLALDRGFLVRYGPARSLFLPKRFVKALRLADKLTPRDLFVADGDEPAILG